MFRLLAVLSLLLISVPAYSAGGGGGDNDQQKCPAGKVLDKKTGKCVDAKLTPVSYDEQYPEGLIPPGFFTYCKALPEECAPVEPDILTSDWMPTLERINREVNAAITFKPDDKDSWDVDAKIGDCDDYTVTKKKRLVEAGVPRGAMRAAYVLPVDEISHVFLVVSTVHGDFVLDNQTDEVYSLDRAKLLRLSIQDYSDPRKWWQVY